jgi:hypothetical protein
VEAAAGGPEAGDALLPDRDHLGRGHHRARKADAVGLAPQLPKALDGANHPAAVDVDVVHPVGDLGDVQPVDHGGPAGQVPADSKPGLVSNSVVVLAGHGALLLPCKGSQSVQRPTVRSQSPEGSAPRRGSVTPSIHADRPPIVTNSPPGLLRS